MVSASVNDSYDVIVVGHGISGMATALSAYEAGANPVILEKSPREKAGGHTRFAGGVFRFPHENPEEVAEELDLEGIPQRYTKEDFYNDLMDVSDGRADEELCQILVDNAYDAIRWIHGHGVEFTLEQKVGDEEERGDEAHPGGRQAAGEGEGVVKSLTPRLEELGIDRHYETEMRELIKDEYDHVKGVKALTPDGIVEYKADAVVLCAGSYVASREKRTKYFGRDGDSYVLRGSRYNTGEALDAALDAGAKSGGQWGGAHQVMLDHRAPQVEGGRTRINGYQYSVILNDDGERFVDEGEDALVKTYAKMGRATYDQPNQRAYVIFDSKIKEHTMSQMHLEPVEADTLEELLEKIDLKDTEQAQKVIQEYNEATNDEVEFDPTKLDGKDTSGITPPRSNWAVPVTEPPFYCYPVKSGITFAFGGVLIDTDSQVLNRQENPITGLWSVGNSTSEFFYGNYPAGAALARGTTYGRRAGKNAAEFALRKDKQIAD